MDKLVRGLLSAILSSISIITMIIMLPIVYVVCFIYDIYWSIKERYSFIRCVKNTNELIINDLIKPFLKALKELWQSV